MAVEGKGEVSACGRSECLGIGDLGSFRDDVTEASVSEEEVDILSEGEDIMVGLSGADIFFEGIFGPEEQEEDMVVRGDEEEFDDYEVCIDDTLEINDYGVYEVQQESNGGVVQSEEIVSRVRALVQSLPLPGQISPQDLVPVNTQLVASNDSYENSKRDVVDNLTSCSLKRKRDSFEEKAKEHESSSQKHTDVVPCSVIASRFQDFEDFLTASTKCSTGEYKMISQVENPAQTREVDQNMTLQNQPSEKSNKTELPSLSGCEFSLVSPVKDIKDSYWPDMVIQTESPAILPTADTTTTTRGRKVYKSQSTRVGADQPNKRLRMEALNFSHSPVPAATTDKYSPAELILTFDRMESIPSESKLNNIFRRFGTLRETETLIYQGSARVVFKKSSDAEVAVSSAKAFNIMGPSVVKYELGYAPLAAMPAVNVENTTSVLQSAESEKMKAQQYEHELINAQDYEPEVTPAQPAQQTQFEHLELTNEVDITVEIEENEGLDYVDIME